MDATEKAYVFLNAAMGQLEHAHEESAYQEKQIDVWRDEAKRWEKRAKDAEVELNNIRAWARTPTKSEQNANNTTMAQMVGDVTGHPPESKEHHLDPKPIMS